FFVVLVLSLSDFFFFFQAEDGIRDRNVTGVQTCALPISPSMDANPDALTTRCSTLSLSTLASPVIRLNQFLARVIPVYTSSLVNTGLSRSGSTRQVWLNSDPWDLCTVMAYTVSSCCNRLGEIQRIDSVPSLLGKATRRVSLTSPLAVLSQGTLKVIPISPFIRPRL